MTQFPFKDRAPDGPEITDYDRALAPTYLRLLDAAVEGADWREVTATLFDRDPEIDPEGSSIIYETHLARARWIAAQGYKDLVWGKS